MLQLMNMEGGSPGRANDIYISRPLMRRHASPDPVGSVQNLQSPHGPFCYRIHQKTLHNSQISW